MVLEKTLKSPLDCKEIQPVHSRGDRSWDFLEGIMLEEVTIGKDSDAGRDWEQEEKGMTEDEMVGWHY